jgi:hypothetical protein
VAGGAHIPLQELFIKLLKVKLSSRPPLVLSLHRRHSIRSGSGTWRDTIYLLVPRGHEEEAGQLVERLRTETIGASKKKNVPAEPDGKLTEELTVFALKGGNLMRRIGINWFESGNTAAYSGSRHSTCVNSRQNGSPHVRFFSAKRGEMRASRMADQEHYANRSLLFFHVEW